MGRGRRRPAAAANPTAQLDRAAERQNLERVNRRSEEIDGEVQELKQIWGQFEDDEHQLAQAAGKPDLEEQYSRLLEDAARLVASCANRFLSVVALGAQGPAGADDYKTISQMPPASATCHVLDTADDLCRLAVNLTWLPTQLQYRMLCASATACLELGPAVVRAWMALAVGDNGQLAPALTASRNKDRESAASWGIHLLRLAVVTLCRLSLLIDADGGQRGTLGSLLRATCATDAKLLPVINFLGEAMKLCSIHFKPACIEVAEEMDQLLKMLNDALWPANDLSDAFLPALLGRHPLQAAYIVRLTAAAMGRNARHLGQLRKAAARLPAGSGSTDAQAAGDTARSTAPMLADSLEIAVSVMCAPAFDSTWRLVGRKLPLAGGTSLQQLPAEEQVWAVASQALQRSVLDAVVSCGKALGLHELQLDTPGSVVSPESFASSLALLLNQLLSGSGGSDGHGGSSQDGAGGASSSGSSRPGGGNSGRRGGRAHAVAEALKLSDNERSVWAMRLTTMLSDALHLCVRVSWPLLDDATAGSNGGSGSDGTRASSRATPATGSGSTAAPPVKPAFVQHLLEQLALTLAIHYRPAMEGEHGHSTLLSELDANVCGAAVGDDNSQCQEAGTSGSGGSTGSGTGHGQGDGSSGGGQVGGTDKGAEHGSSTSGQGSGVEEDEEEEEEEKEEEQEEDEERPARQQALWTLRVLLEAVALRLPPADVAESADSLAAATCQIIEAAARPGAAMHLVFAAVMYADQDPAEAAGAADAADTAAEAAGRAADTAGTATAAGTAAAAGAAGAAQPSAEPGAAVKASGQQQPSAAGAAEPACHQDEITGPAESIMYDLDLAGCARALTWLMAALLESGQGASLTPQQHSAALRTLLLLLRTAAKHALAAASAVVDTPAAVIIEDGFDANMATWLLNSAQLLAWAACAVALRARVWREAGGMDEASQQRLAGGVLAALAAADELQAALQYLDCTGSAPGGGGSGGSAGNTSAGQQAAAEPVLTAEEGAESVAAAHAAASTAEAVPPPCRPGDDEPLAPALALAAARSWALAACPAVLQLPRGQAGLEALGAELSRLPADSCKAPMLLASCLQGLLDAGRDAQHGPSMLRQLCRQRALSGAYATLNSCLQDFSEPEPATLLLPPLMEALAGCLGGIPATPSSPSLNQQLGLEGLHPHAPWRLTALLQGAGPVRQWAASPASWNLYWRVRYCNIYSLEEQEYAAAEAAGTPDSGAAQPSAGGQQQKQQQQQQQQQVQTARALGRLRCSHLGCRNVHGSSEASVPSRRCSACRLLRFCSNECSQEAWRTVHRPVCKLLQAEAQQAAAAAAAAGAAP